MSRDASISFEWGEEETTFALRWGELAKLQEARDCGPYVLLERLLSGRWRIEDVREVIRWGLIGGGKKPEEAAKLIRQFVEGFPPVENLIPAQRIMGAGCVGAPDEPSPGEADAPNPAAETASTISPTAS